MNEFIERFEAFTISVTKAYKYIQKIKLAEAENIGLKANNIMYMYHLGKNPEGLTSTELSKLCVEDKAAVSRAIVDLTDKGFIRSVERDLMRKYRSKIILTEKGKEKNKQLNEAIAEAVAKASSSINECEREKFYSILFYITDNLELICKNYNKK